MLYYILYLIIAFSLLAELLGKKRSKWLYPMAVVILIVYCSLRDPFIYPDNAIYYESFKSGEYNLEEKFMYGFLYLRTICKYIYPSFVFYLSVISVLVIGSYAKIIKDYSPYIWLSLFLYVLINYFPSFFLLRQYLSMAVFLFSVKYIIKRKPLEFGICAIIAMSFHPTAILTVPLYSLYGMKKNFWNMSFLAVGSIIVVVVFVSLGQYVEKISVYYAHYFGQINDDPAWQRAAMKVYILVVYLFAMGAKFYHKGITRVVFYCLVFSVIICVAAMRIPIVYRLREYYALADFIGVPIILKQVMPMKTIKKHIVIALLTVYIVLLIISFNRFINSDNMNNMYRFVWEQSSFLL